MLPILLRVSPVVIGAAVAAVQHPIISILKSIKNYCTFRTQMKIFLLIKLRHQCEKHNKVTGCYAFRFVFGQYGGIKYTYIVLHTQGVAIGMCV